MCVARNGALSVLCFVLCCVMFAGCYISDPAPSPSGGPQQFRTPTNCERFAVFSLKIRCLFFFCVCWAHTKSQWLLQLILIERLSIGTQSKTNNKLAAIVARGTAAIDSVTYTPRAPSFVLFACLWLFACVCVCVCMSMWRLCLCVCRAPIQMNFIQIPNQTWSIA